MSSTTKYAIIAVALLSPIALLAYHSVTREDPALPKVSMSVGLVAGLLAIGGGAMLISSALM